eukprot:COSAG02_NODE_26659_length_624_cov_0.635161_1_plen_24_part_10
MSETDRQTLTLTGWVRNSILTGRV